MQRTLTQGTVTRDVTYHVGSVPMIGMVSTPSAAAPARPVAVLLLPDAFGLTGDALITTEALTAAGYTVFAADLWGQRLTPGSPDEIGPLIGGLVADHDNWMARVGAAAEALRTEIGSATPIVAVGHCFGGSSALEYARAGADLAGVVAIHPGLDLVGFDWPAQVPTRQILICCGTADPMATPEQRLAWETGAAALRFQIQLYSSAKHGFTSTKLKGAPPSPTVGYDEWAAAKAWSATLTFLGDFGS